MRLRSVQYKYLVAVAFTIGLFMDLMDTTIVNVALPKIGVEFHLDPRTGNDILAWVVTGYLLSLAVWIPASGWIGDRFGTKKTFTFALAMFTAGSILCGVAPNIGSLIVFRIIQGIGGGMLTPVGTAMLFRAFPPEERARASAITAGPIVIAPALGPILGGWMVDSIGWRWIFFVNVPIGILGVLFMLFYIQEHVEEAPGRLDVMGFLLSAAGLALVLYALSQAPSDGWGSANVIGTGVLGILCFVALVMVELRQEIPMLDFRLLGDRMFRNATIIFFVASATMIGVLFLMPLFLQQLLHQSALESGLTTFPQALGVITIMPFSDRLYPRIGPRRLLIAGMLGLAGTSALVLFIGLDTNLWWLRGILYLMGIALGFILIPIEAATFATIRPEDTGRASALSNTGRQAGSSLGVAVLATVLADRTKTHIADAIHAAGGAAKQLQLAPSHGGLLAYHDAFFVAAILTLFGAAFALLIHDEDAAATMHPATAQPAAAGEAVVPAAQGAEGVVL